MIELIAEIFLRIICQYPGAFIRWAIFRKRRFEDYLKDDWDANLLPVILLILAILVVNKLAT